LSSSYIIIGNLLGTGGGCDVMSWWSVDSWCTGTEDELGADIQIDSRRYTYSGI